MHAEQVRGGEDMRIEGAVGAGRRDYGDFADARGLRRDGGHEQARDERRVDKRIADLNHSECDW